MQLQTALQWEGFYDSAIDGDVGPGTRSAMAAWQAAKGYDPSGVLTTEQRAQLVASYTSAMDSLGLAPVHDETAGIDIMMPTAMVKKGAYQPPFAHYDSVGDSGVQVILISQSGDKRTLFGLYDILQTLDVIPLDGPREKRKDSFIIDGTSDTIVTHVEAQLTQAGNVKGFILIWPRGDEQRRKLVLTAMRSSFQALPDAVLPDSAGPGQHQSVDLLSGLTIRRPAVSATGFYFDGDGNVLTAASAVEQCSRITLDDDTEVKVAAKDPSLGLAVLKASELLVPMGYARLQPSVPRLGAEVAVSGFAYNGRLGAPVLTFGQIEDVKGLNGEADKNRLNLSATAGDAGGPVFDQSGAVVGMLLASNPPQGTVLPQAVRFSVPAATIAEFLSNNGFSAAAAEPSGDLQPELLTGVARNMTVHVACWN
jgi:S1-C subfamily serine protease